MSQTIDDLLRANSPLSELDRETIMVDVQVLQDERDHLRAQLEQLQQLLRILSTPAGYTAGLDTPEEIETAINYVLTKGLNDEGEYHEVCAERDRLRAIAGAERGHKGLEGWAIDAEYQWWERGSYEDQENPWLVVSQSDDTLGKWEWEIYGVPRDPFGPHERGEAATALEAMEAAESKIEP